MFILFESECFQINTCKLEVPCVCIQLRQGPLFIQGLLWCWKSDDMEKGVQMVLSCFGYYALVDFQAAPDVGWFGEDLVRKGAPENAGLLLCEPVTLDKNAGSLHLECNYNDKSVTKWELTKIWTGFLEPQVYRLMKNLLFNLIHTEIYRDYYAPYRFPLNYKYLLRKNECMS